MNSNTEKYKKLVGRYLENELSPSEKDSFKREITTNPALKAELDLQRKMRRNVWLSANAPQVDAIKTQYGIAGSVPVEEPAPKPETVFEKIWNYLKPYFKLPKLYIPQVDGTLVLNTRLVAAMSLVLVLGAGVVFFNNANYQGGAVSMAGSLGGQANYQKTYEESQYLLAHEHTEKQTEAMIGKLKSQIQTLDKEQIWALPFLNYEIARLYCDLKQYDKALQYLQKVDTTADPELKQETEKLRNKLE